MWEYLPHQVRLRGAPRLTPAINRLLREDFDRFRAGLPPSVESYIHSAYGIDLTTEYGGSPVKNPFGKASGQLSLALHQIERDALAGLGFLVLKTGIAQNERGEQAMQEWAIPETRMLVERVRGRRGVEGWTVTWKGRGWFDTFEAYLRLFDESLAAGREAGMLVAPSAKYHLPTPEEGFWKEKEYAYTTHALVETWNKHHPGQAMPLEKDFSPTLAGSERATQKAKILEWLRTVPRLIHSAAPGQVRVGLKIFNTLFEDDFQLQMLDAVHVTPPGDGRADFLVYANRLFDPAKAFEGKRGVAYGGPDLSDRNLAALERFLALWAVAATVKRNSPNSRPVPYEPHPLPLSATGDIHSGRIAAEYLLRGASSFQMHTLFQLPDSEFSMRTGTKTEKALHHLLFHPSEGFLAWVLDLSERFGWGVSANVKDMAAWCQANCSRIIPEFSLVPE